MKVRMTLAGTSLGARLTALCWGALTLLAPLAVSACTSGASSTPTVPTFSATVTGPATGSSVPASSATSPGSGSTTSPGSGSTTSPGSGSTTSPGSATTTPAPHTATATATVTVTPTPTSSRIPSAAPVTGGGGTAGLQDGLLFALGAAAILVGAGSIIYRRWLTRNR